MLGGQEGTNISGYVPRTTILDDESIHVFLQGKRTSRPRGQGGEMNLCKRIVHTSGKIVFRCDSDDAARHKVCAFFKHPVDGIPWCAYNRTSEGGVTDECGNVMAHTTALAGKEGK